MLVGDRFVGDPVDEWHRLPSLSHHLASQRSS